MSRNPYSPISPYATPTSPSSPLSPHSPHSLYSPSSTSYPQYSPGVSGLSSPISRNIYTPGGYITQTPQSLSSPLSGTTISTPVIGSPHTQETYIPQVPIDDIRYAYYICGDCGRDVVLKIGKTSSDAVACTTCGERILYKKRSNIPMQYEAR